MFFILLTFRFGASCLSAGCLQAIVETVGETCDVFWLVSEHQHLNLIQTYFILTSASEVIWWHAFFYY